MLGRPDLPLDASILQAGVERCDSLAFTLRLARPMSAEEVRAGFAATPAVRVEEDAVRLSARACAGSPELHVGRIRAGTRGPGSLCFFAVGDQLRLGSALAALAAAARLPLG